MQNLLRVLTLGSRAVPPSAVRGSRELPGYQRASCTFSLVTPRTQPNKYVLQYSTTPCAPSMEIHRGRRPTDPEGKAQNVGHGRREAARASKKCDRVTGRHPQGTARCQIRRERKNYYCGDNLGGDDRAFCILATIYRLNPRRCATRRMRKLFASA